MIASTGETSRRAAQPLLAPALRVLHTGFWVLLFVVFPLASVPQFSLQTLPHGLIGYPDHASAEYFLPKIVVFCLLWFLGAGLWLHTRRRPGRAGFRRERPLALLAWFLAGLLFTGMLTTGNLNFMLPGVGSRFEGLGVGVLEAAWFSLVLIGAGLVRTRVLPVRLPLALLAAGGVATGGWVLLEAYGPGPLGLAGAAAPANNLAGTLGHQAYVAAFTGVVLSFWLVLHTLGGRLRPLHVLVAAILMAALVASGGRAGLLATLFVLAAATVYAWRMGRGRRALALLLPVLAVGGLVMLSSTHAQKRVARIGTAIQGDDGSVNHRFIFWDIARQAILDRPLIGYGPYALHYLAWQYASPDEARALLTEFLPPQSAERAVRIGKLAFYPDPDSGALRVRVMNPYGVHNYFLDMALAHGLPTMLLFLAFLLAVALALWRARTPLALATLAALTTYLLYGMFWFPTINVDPMVWGLVGIGLSGARVTPERA